MSRPTILHRLEYWGFLGLERALRLCPVKTVFKIGEGIGSLCFKILPKYRGIVRRNLNYAFAGEKDQDQIETLIRDIFRRNGANFLTSFKLPFCSTDEIKSYITIEGIDILQDVLKQQRGMVMLTPHMGNWELMAQVAELSDPGLKLGTHYRPSSNPLMDRLIKDRRSKRGLTLFAQKDSSHKLTSFIREGAGLGILADQRVRTKGALALFFGRPTAFSPLPSLIARRSKSLMIGLRCETVGPAQWILRWYSVSGNSTQDCADSFESAWRSSPSDVFWFQDRWKLQGPAPLEFLSQKTNFPLDRVTKKIRIVSLGEVSATRAENESPLIHLEVHSCDFKDSDESLSALISSFHDNGSLPIDAIITPESQQKRIQKLCRETAVLSESKFQESLLFPLDPHVDLK